VTAARAGRQRNWVTAFRRSSVGRAIGRRLPVRAKRWLRVGRRWQRSAVAQIKLRWHRSLQLRVVSTTLVLSGLVIAVLGFFLIQSVAAGLLSNAENSADALVRNGRTSAIGQSSVNVLAPSPADTATIVDVATTTARALQQPSGTTGSYLVFIQLTNIDPAIVHWVGQSNVNITATIPQTLIAKVKDEQKSEKFVNKNTVPPAYEPTTLVYNSGNSVPALAVGVPLSGYYQLYYVFPFTQQQATLLLVQRVLVGVALAVIVLLAAIASLVTRWVVLPVRHAAAAAQRVSAGHLGERMHPLPRARVRDLDLVVGVVAAVLEHIGLGVRVRVLEHRQAAGSAVAVEHERGGVPVGEVEPAPRLQEPGDDARPLRDVGQPADRAPGREDEVEGLGLGQQVSRVVDVRLHEAGPIVDAELGRHAPRLLDRRQREVEADHARAAVRERERVGAEVALQVQHAHVVHAVREQAIDARPRDGVEHAVAPPQRLLVVEVRRDVHGHALVPVRPVGGAPLPLVLGQRYEAIS